MWEKTLDSGVVPGLGGAVVPGLGGMTGATGGALATSGGSPADGGARVDGGDAASPEDASAGNEAGIDSPVVDGGSATSTDGGDALAVTDGLTTLDVVGTGGIGGVTQTGGTVSTGGALPDGAVDVSLDLPADTAGDTPVVPADTAVDQAAADTPLASGPLVHYRFESATGDQLADDSGNNHPGTLVGPYALVPGPRGNALSLTAPTGVDGGVPASYVSLPANLFDGLEDMTVAIWIKLNANLNWTRVFDFGSGQTAYMFLSTSAMQTGAVRFAISTAAIAGEQRLEGPVLATNTWVHLAVVLDASGGKLYVNGALAASNPALSLRASGLGGTTNNWIGRSQFTTGTYNDPYLDGMIDDFRVYDRALGASEIAALAAN